MSKRTAYHHGDLRSALLQASLALIDESGIGALSLREVARKAGVSHNAPYPHFRDRGRPASRPAASLTSASRSGPRPVSS